MTDRVDAFADDIAAGPEALARLLETWQPIDLGGRARFAFAGLGSSRFAAQLVAAQLRAEGLSASVDYASTMTPIPLGDDLVFVAISASGRTPEVVSAARRQGGHGLVVAVTNDAGGPLAAVADVVVRLEAGEERSGIAGRTFRATVAALAILCGLAGPTDLRPAVDALASRVAGGERWAQPMADRLDGAPAIDVLADAALLGLAEQAALMLREAPRLPAHAAETADWLHTGVYLAWPGHRVLRFRGSPSDDEVTSTVARRGGELVDVPTSDDPIDMTTDGRAAGIGRIRRALVESVVAERVALELWRRASAEATT